MIVAIHQPNFLPCIGYFYKLIKSDIFVLLDDVQFTKNSFINRNRIKTPNGAQWITVSIIHKGRFRQMIFETEIANENKWKKKILGSFRANYSKSTFFQKYYPVLETIIMNKYERLVDLNIALLKWVLKELEIDTSIVCSSTIKGVEGYSTERLISICRALGFNNYLSGFGGENYQDKKLYQEADIKLLIYDFQPPIYPQLWGDFLSNLSIVDLLFNCGYNSKKIIYDQQR